MVIRWSRGTFAAKKSKSHWLRSVLLFSLLFLASAVWAGTNSALMYQGRIVRPDGSPVNTGAVIFTLSVYSPSPSRCLLYSETQAVGMSASQGMFSLALGTGVRTDTGSHSFADVFINGKLLSPLICASGTSYTGGSTDDRELSVSFTESGTVVNLSSMSIKSVPFAMQAHGIDGWGLNNLVKVSSVGSPSTFTVAEMNNVKTIGAASCATNEILKWNGSAWACASDATGGAPVDAAYTGTKGILAFNTDAATSGVVISSGVATVNSGTGANQIVKLDSAAKLPAVDGSALTNLSLSQISAGTLPISKGGTGAVTKAAAFDALSPNSAKGDITVSNGTTNVSLPLGSNGQILTADSSQSSGVKWANAPATGLTNVTAGTGLNVGAGPGGSVTSTGTLNVDVGTGANQIVQLTSGSKLPAVDGSLLTNLSLSQISAGTLPVSQGGTGTSSFAANRLIGTNGTGTAQQIVTCSLNQVISFDSSGNYGCYNLNSLVSGFANGGNAFAADATLGTTDTYALSFKTDNSTRMTILSNGNVGIGTTSPGSALTVNGAIVTPTPADNATTSIDWSKGNAQTTSAATGAFTFSNLQDGGIYALYVTNTTNRTFSFTTAGLTYNSGTISLTTTGSSKVLFTFVRYGTVVVVGMSQGY